MTTTSAPLLAAQLGKLNAAQNAYASQFVSGLLAAACEHGASDVHLHPTASGLEIRWRNDGVLQPVGTFPSGEAADVVSPAQSAGGAAHATAVLARGDTQALFSTASSAGLVPLFSRACQAVESGQTDPAEIRRVLGFEVPGPLA